jgi:DNA helicase-2/ATP-dependent DNA helicase PcrA
MNPAQQQAVQAGCGPLMVLAGAGSGKTRVLTHRIAAMLQGHVGGRCWPSQVLSVTFTNKAAKEMRERVAKLVGEADAKSLWMGTFHSICARLLRRDILHYKSTAGRQWQTNFVIYDETDSVGLLKDILKRHNMDEKLYPPKAIKHQISELKNQGLDAYAAASQAKNYQAERLGVLFDAYEAGLAENNALDFDDLLLVTVKLLQQNPQLLANYYNHFRHILVDEYQDTNGVQYELVRLLATGQPTHSPETPPDWTGRSLTVVGDVDQSIYSWRGANFRILMNFESDFKGASRVNLLHNYRSTGTILKVANTIINNNQERLPKDLLSVKGVGSPITCFEANDEREEAHWVIDKLLHEAKTTGKQPGDCCILYRTNVQSRALEDVLMAQGIPYAMIGGLKFYERREIKDVMAYLTVLFNESDGYSVKRVLNVPKRGIGKTSIEHIDAAAQASGLTFYQVLQRIDQVPQVKGKAANAIAQFVTVIERLKQLTTKNAPIDEVMLAIRSLTGYDLFLQEEDPHDNDNRLANLDELVSVARQFHANNPPDENGEGGGLADFLAQMSLLSDLDKADGQDLTNRLVLMTMHAAKGLEFPLVAVVGLEEGMFPHSRSLNDTTQMEEERRLMYVAVTRAEDTLLLSFARRRMVFGEIKYSMPSRFLSEIPRECLTGNFSLDAEGSFASRDESERWGGGGQRWGNSRNTTPRDSARDNSPAQPLSRPRLVSDDGRLEPTGKLNVGKLTPPTSQPQPQPEAFTGTLLNKGDRVRHAKFGEGTVVQVIGSGSKVLYNVQFDGIEVKKLIDPKFAQLVLV